MDVKTGWNASSQMLHLIRGTLLNQLLTSVSRVGSLFFRLQFLKTCNWACILTAAHRLLTELFTVAGSIRFILFYYNTMGVAMGWWLASILEILTSWRGYHEYKIDIVYHFWHVMTDDCIPSRGIWKRNCQLVNLYKNSIIFYI